MHLPSIVLTSLALICQLLFVQQVNAKTSVWKISKGDDYFYLGGTFHILAPDDHPLPEEFMEAYADSQEVILETDISAGKSTSFQQEMMAEMMLEPGQQLEGQLTPETYSRLEEFMAERGLPIQSVASFKPWAVTLLLALQEYAAMGMVEEFGIETVFTKRSIEDSKTIQSLETPQQQIKFLASLGDVDPDISVNYTLDDLKKVREYTAKLKQAWRTGNMELLESNTAVVDLKQKFPSVYNKLITTRNNNWMKQLVTLFDDNAIEIVLVGAMHLVGDEGLLNRLEAEGFNVRQLD